MVKGNYTMEERGGGGIWARKCTPFFGTFCIILG